MVLVLLIPAMPARAEDQTYLYAVQITAVVQTNPPRITLSWPQDYYGANSYTIYRKTKTATSWGTGTVLSGATTTYVDNNVSVGAAYEYQIFKASTVGYRGYGYIYAGINAPLTDSRGTLILIVATNSTGALSSELQQLQTGLVGDGWSVIRHDVSSNDTPVSVKNLIVADYNADPANVSALFLFGHVPVLHSGNLNYDGHQARPMPADAYYGDVNGNWSTNPDFLPSDVELMVGRVDMFAMPGNGAPVGWPNETELLRRYLNKNHAWRQRQTTFTHRALMGNLRGDEAGEATAASGYRNFDPLVGHGNTIEANVETTNGVPVADRWISKLAAGTYLWAYGCGAGQPTAISGLGTKDGSLVNDAYSIDVVGQDAKGAFVMLFGSWFGNWDDTDDIMRSVLAAPTGGLAACMAGRPHWYFHHMGLGETIGYSTRLTMNNDGSLYQNHSNIMNRAIYIALMGDPTLRQDMVAPAANLIASAGPGSVNLSWSPSSDSLAGYHVYRAGSPSGPFARLTSSLVTATSYSDPGVAPTTYTYMVRAVALQTAPSGTYFNPSQGIFVNTTVPVSVQPITVVAARSGNNLILTWNSQAGISYHVQYKDAFLQSTWNNLDNGITASGSVCTSTDSNIDVRSRRLYRVVSP